MSVNDRASLETTIARPYQALSAAVSRPAWDRPVTRTRAPPIEEHIRGGEAHAAGAADNHYFFTFVTFHRDPVEMSECDWHIMNCLVR